MQRGLFRVWLTISVGWIVFTFWETDALCKMGFNFGPNLFCDLIYEGGPLRAWINLLASSLAPPLLLLISYFVVKWITQGFKQK